VILKNFSLRFQRGTVCLAKFARLNSNERGALLSYLERGLTHILLRLGSTTISLASDCPTNLVRRRLSNATSNIIVLGMHKGPSTAESQVAEKLSELFVNIKDKGYKYTKARVERRTEPALARKRQNSPSPIVGNPASAGRRRELDVEPDPKTDPCPIRRHTRQNRLDGTWKT